MLIYRSPRRAIETRRGVAELLFLIERIRESKPPEIDLVRELLINLGEIECGVADFFCPEKDSNLPVLQESRKAGVLSGRLLACCFESSPEVSCMSRDRVDEIDALCSLIIEAVKRCAAFPLPDRVGVSIPEGYAFYGLYPEMYLMSARRFYAEHRPHEAVCIGIRSIGTSLGAAVAGQLECLGCRTHSFTVRPHGHPFERGLILSSDLEERLRSLREHPFLIVDEGPGLSGSSFCGTALKIAGLGVPERNIFLFPSWEPDPTGFLSKSAQRHWPRFVKYSTCFEAIRNELGLFKQEFREARIKEISAGQWRSLVYTDEKDYPAVQLNHERRKYLVTPRRQQSHELKQEKSFLWKFCGLGRYGRKAYRRALTLARAGFHPPVTGLCDGFLGMEFPSAIPRDGDKADAPFLDRAAAYFAFIEKEFPADEGTSPDEVLEMIRINVEKGLGQELMKKCMGQIRALSWNVNDCRPVYLDNRVAPHEWIDVDKCIYKVDGAEHFEDHFFPGPQDICWDLAGFCIEFGLGSRERTCFLNMFEARSGGIVPEAKLSFYSLAYLSFKMGYCIASAATLSGTTDGARFEMLGAKYSSLLKKQLISTA